MENTDTFFEEKLGVPVEYLNPFTSVNVGPNVQGVEEDIHLLGEVVGLALRNTPFCRMKINLMPPDLVALKTFRGRLPYFAGSVLVVLGALIALWCLESRTIDLRQKQLSEISERVKSTEDTANKLHAVRNQNAAVSAKVNDLTNLIESKTLWLEMVTSVHDSLLPGMWVTRITPKLSQAKPFASFELKASGFEDSLKAYDSADQTTAEVFRDRLRASLFFSDETKLKTQRMQNGWLREFTLNVHLEKPMTAR